MVGAQQCAVGSQFHAEGDVRDLSRNVFVKTEAMASCYSPRISIGITSRLLLLSRLVAPYHREIGLYALDIPV